MTTSTKMVKRAYRFRFYPDDAQAGLLSRTFGCARFVYNKALAARTTAWKDEQRRISYNDTSALLTGWKKEPEMDWLNEVSSVPLQQSLRHLHAAFVNFWDKRAAYPKFKSKKFSPDTAEFTYRAFTFTHANPETGTGPVLTLAKTEHPLDVVWHRNLPATDPSTVTVTRDSAGRWFVSLLFEDTVETLPLAPHTIAGVDLGQDALATVSAVTADGVVLETVIPGLMPRKNLHAKLVKTQRVAARKTRGSKNRAKAQATVARIHAKIADQRRDHLHKTSLALVRDNQAIGLEDLDVRGMTASNRGTVENPGTGVRKKSVSNRNNLDTGYRMFRTMVEYKAGWYGRDVVTIDRFYPSTQLCSAPGCGHIQGRIPTQVREWTCARCGTIHDRELNAATNIRAAATAVLACGDGVRLRGPNKPRGQDTVDETGNLRPRGRKPAPSGAGS